MHGKQGTVGKIEDEIIAEVFPNITFGTYSGLLAKRGQKVIKEQSTTMTSEMLNSPKGQQTKQFKQVFNKLYKTIKKEILF